MLLGYGRSLQADLVRIGFPVGTGGDCPSVIYVTMSAKNIKPTVVGHDITTPLGPEDFYAGCYARASVTPFAFKNIGEGIALGLNHIQKLKDGERLDSYGLSMPT